MKTVAIVPYYGGEHSPANGNSPVAKRADYLRRTVESLQGFADSVVVGRLAGDHTVPVLNDVHENATSEAFYCEPHLIPATLCRWVQRTGRVLDGHDFVYVTEADQVLHCDPLSMPEVSGWNYLVPYRLEQLAANGVPWNKGPVVEYDGNKYAICNAGAYGGAFLSTAELFLEIEFSDTASMPVETVTGFAANAIGQFHMTPDWGGFFVEHLSGYDYHKKLAGET
jgi:hypothetical protein